MKKLVVIFVLGLCPWISPPVKVVRAVTETVYPGRQESPVYTRYEILVVAGKSSGELTIDRLYISKQPCPVKLYSWPEGKKIRSFIKGDTLLVRATHYKTGQPQKETQKPSAGILEHHKVVLSFTMRNKRKFLPVEDITQKPDNINL